jgi:hypothetical protein
LELPESDERRAGNGSGQRGNALNNSNKSGKFNVAKIKKFGTGSLALLPNLLMVSPYFLSAEIF